MACQSHLWHWLWFSHPHALSLYPASKSKCLSFMFASQQTLNSTSFTNYLLDVARDADDIVQNHRWLYKLFAREYLNSMQYAKRPSYLLIIYSLLIKKKREKESEYVLGLKYRLLSKFLSICFGCNFPFRFATSSITDDDLLEYLFELLTNGWAILPSHVRCRNVNDSRISTHRTY